MRTSVVFAATALELEELGELRAVRAEGTLAKSKPARGALRSLSRAAQSTVKGQDIDVQQRETFENAGWVFALHRETTVAVARNLTKGEPENAVRRIFRTQDGQLLIDSNRLIVRAKPTWDVTKAAAELDKRQLRLVRPLRFAPGIFEVAVRSYHSVEDAQRLTDDPRLEYAEPDFLQELPPRARPLDPYYPRQWQWHNDGSNGGVAGADVGAEAAWAATLGDSVRVAVIDNGMDVTHPDLEPGIVGGGYYEEDGMGSATFVAYVMGDKNFPAGDHGTFCLGMAGARWNNQHGGVGGAPRSGLMPVACIPDQVGSQSTLARAVAYAATPRLEDANASADSGAHVMSCSLGPNSGSFYMTSVLRDAIDHAVGQGRGGRGTLVFWAVSNGNEPVSIDDVCSYRNTIAVGRSSRLDLQDGSAYGPALDFLAPGVDVYSTYDGGKYGHGTGTSYAAPCAASVGALVAALNPDFTWQQIRDRMRETCEKIGTDPYIGGGAGGRNDRYGFGRVDAAQAVR